MAQPTTLEVVYNDLLDKSREYVFITDIEYLKVGARFSCILGEIVVFDRHDLSRRPIYCNGGWLWVARWQEHVLAGDYQVLRSGHRYEPW